MKTKKNKATNFNDVLKEELKDSKFNKYYQEYSIQFDLAYKISQLRQQKNISQETLAKKIGTSQSNIARFERGGQNFTISFLDKIARALKVNLEIKLT